ncbi:MAG TPA: glycosyltransferase [Actinophytocola sp.]|uniref:glycosyltransferase n=1 Tax=Actinophytocola sp. TaxID=1872138 RepID=UPI002DDD5129|nr:glycosyltransferase [Actinophytocola sp.]HEV2777944.1 glycosyltransferase [Actinophytocola sp.]
MRPASAHEVEPVPATNGTPVPGALLQRVIVARQADPLDVRGLYLDEDPSNPARSRAISRTSMRIPAQAEVSFAAYFNAFPASYWRRWTTLDEVVLRIRVQGSCRVDIYRSKADGGIVHVRGEMIEGPGPVVRDFRLELAPFSDGGWYWFDITTEDDEVVISDSGWYAGVPAPGRASLAIGITTFNRNEDLLGVLTALGGDPLVLEAINTVFVADGGTRKVRAAEGFEAAAAGLGDRLRVIEQPNYGGSGGYARSMFEALTTTDAEQIMFMDDDIVVEPDAILRAVAFSRFAQQPMLVGGQMLSVQRRSVLQSMGEVVDRYVMRWRIAPNCELNHDFADESLRESEELHRRIDVDFNAWWMCLIPRVVAERVGLPMPFFIKGDDMEYGLRAGEAGFPTATVPGIAVWHMPFEDKDDVTDWQAYFHLRNRLINAALHGTDPTARGLLKETMKITLKHLLSLEYSTIALQEMAINDFLAGPDTLFDRLGTALPEVRERRAQFDDGRIVSSTKEFPLPTADAVWAEQFLTPPTGKVKIVRTLLSGLLHNLRPVSPEHQDRPQLNIPAQDARWFLMGRLDGATVTTADGRGVAFRKRDPRLFRAMLRQAIANHARVSREFPRLRQAYREALPDLTSIESWRKKFES